MDVGTVARLRIGNLCLDTEVGAGGPELHEALRPNVAGW